MYSVLLNLLLCICYCRIYYCVFIIGYLLLYICYCVFVIVGYIIVYLLLWNLLCIYYYYVFNIVECKQKHKHLHTVYKAKYVTLSKCLVF